MQVRWKKMAQDPSLDPSHPMSWDEPLGETQWSIWVPSDTAELENYAGYIVSCSTWQEKFTYLFNKITTHNFISLICTMKWLEVQRQNFTQQPSIDNPKGTRGQPSPLCYERRTQQWGWTPTHPGVLTSRQIVVLLVLKLGAVPSKEATGDSKTSRDW